MTNYLAELKTQIERPKPHLTLDLEEVTLVDVGVVTAKERPGQR